MTEAELVEEMISEILTEEQNFLKYVEPGDIAFVIGDAFYTWSKFRYATAGKGYKVLSKGGECINCESDIVGENQFLSASGVSHVERDGLVVWDQRQIVEWKYYNDKTVDSRGYIINPDVKYRGYFLSGITNENNCVMLVQLLTPFRNGKIGDKIIVNIDEVVVT